MDSEINVLFVDHRSRMSRGPPRRRVSLEDDDSCGRVSTASAVPIPSPGLSLAPIQACPESMPKGQPSATVLDDPSPCV